MEKPTRWIAIMAALFMACAVLHAAPATHKHKKKVVRHRVTHHYRYRRHYYRRRIRLPKGPSRERTMQIQTALSRNGYYQGDPTGKWDANTIAAVQKFQSANNMDATGKIDAPTLQKLGLGSDIAGVAAPKPVVPKVSAPDAGAVPAVPAKPTVAPNPAATTADHAQQPAAGTSTNAQSSSSAAAGASSAATIAPAAAASSPSDPASKAATNQR